MQLKDLGHGHQVMLQLLYLTCTCVFSLNLHNTVQTLQASFAAWLGYCDCSLAGFGHGTSSCGV